MENIITYLKPVSNLKKVFGAVVILFAFYILIFESILFGAFMIAFAVYLASSEGSQINLDTSTYRTIWSLFSIHFGKWKPCPDFEYISVFKGKQSQRVNGLGASTKFIEEVFLVNLFYERNKHLTFHRTFEKEDAFKVAKHFYLALGIDVLDATDREQKWINVNDIWEEAKEQME